MTIDARGPDEIDPHGQVANKQYDLIKNELENISKKYVFFIHYPPVSLDTPWLDRDMLILNGEKLHELFAKSKNKILSVHFGHVHRGFQITRDGVFYSSVPSTCIQFTAYPSDEHHQYESTGKIIF